MAIFFLRPTIAHHLLLAIITKVRARYLCRLRRSCRWLYEFSSTYNWKLNNIVQINVLSFSSCNQHETDWRKVAIITSKRLNNYGPPLSDYNVEDFRRLRVMRLELPNEAESSAWLEGFLQHLEKYQVCVKELKFCVSSEETFKRILQSVNPLKVEVFWLNPTLIDMFLDQIDQVFQSSKVFSLAIKVNSTMEPVRFFRPPDWTIFDDLQGESEHDETGSSFLTSFESESLGLAYYSSDQSMLSEYSHSE